MILKTYSKKDALESLSEAKYLFATGADGEIITVDTSIDDGIVNGVYTSNAPCPFSDAEIQAEVTRLQAEYDAQEYARDRAKAYPSMEDQADMQFHDLINGTTTWQDAIQAVKDAHPKS